MSGDIGTHIDVMRLLLNASSALSNARYFIGHHDEYDGAARSAETQLFMALNSLEQLKPMMGDDHGAAMIAAELTLCHAHAPNDDRATCRMERGHSGDHVTGHEMFEQQRRARWLDGTIYDFERAEAEAFISTAVATTEPSDSERSTQ